MDTAKVFWSGRSQAVRLPKRFRVDGNEVRITQQGKRIILEPVAETWDWLDAVVGTFDEDFIAAVNEAPPPTETRDFKKIFGS